LTKKEGKKKSKSKNKYQSTLEASIPFQQFRARSAITLGHFRFSPPTRGYLEAGRFRASKRPGEGIGCLFQLLATGRRLIRE
jgi:hypothetical protein